MDRNTVIGFILIGILLVLMFYFNSKSNQAYQEEKRIKDSIANALKPKPDSSLAKADSSQLDSLKKAQAQLPGTFQKATNAIEKNDTLENEVLKIVFTSKGGQPQYVELKKFKAGDGKALVMHSGKNNKLSYQINTGVANQVANSADLDFDVEKKSNGDGSTTLIYSLKDSSGVPFLTNQYTIRKDDYMIDLNIGLSNPDKQITQNNLNLLWQTESKQTEKNIPYEKQQSHICYLYNGKYDFTTMGTSGDEKFEKPLSWLAVNPQFFVTTLIAKDKFSGAQMNWTSPVDSLGVICQATTNARINLAPGAKTVSLQLYYGPNDYNVLKKYDNEMQQIVTYGSGLFSFVKYINRYFLLPVWDLLKKWVSSFGIVILLLTLIIRLITSPILYKSYVSGAKMKALKPEIDKLKAKFGDDKQAFSMEQMKLWKSAGVSPLGGCLPALLQIPIFMSLYYFFQANIDLRGQSFLWAKDLAAYDSIAHLPFYIPLYGDHVSLFTLTAVITSLLISLYSMSNMQDNSNPVMKYMPYIFPILLLGIFNRLPAALTWYYTVSNTITLILQYVIQNYIIDHDKILSQIEENRKRPVKQSKLQERIQAMQESNKRLQDLKNKPNKR